MANYDQVVARWVDRVMGRTDRPNYSNPRMYGSGDRIYSYGSHFEIGRLTRWPKNDAPRMFLLNGDRFSPTTTKHQNYVRWAVQREGLPVVIIPYSALEAAGVAFDSVELIDVTADRHETIHHTSYEKPPRAVWQEVEEFEDVPLTDAEVEAKLAERNAKHVEEWERHRSYAEEEAKEFAETGKYRYGRTTALWAEYLAPGSAPQVTTREDLERTHWGHTRPLTKRVKVGSHMVLLRAPKSWRTIDVEELPDGRTRYSWDTTRHWLGESLIRAKVPTVTRPRCKACDGRGFFGVHPREAVHEEDYTNRHDYWQDRHTATELGRCQRCDGQGSRLVRRTRTAYFLSGFDQQETRPPYFFCELPKGSEPTTVAEAYECLKPDTVRIAEQMGRTIHRQGDIFAVELRGVDKRELRKRGARFEKRGPLFGTNHVATETAYLPDGTTLVRGTLWHVPEWRDPDHRRVTVGKSWHIAIKNTVPVAA